jgi:hypothetical protein
MLRPARFDGFVDVDLVKGGPSWCMVTPLFEEIAMHEKTMHVPKGYWKFDEDLSHKSEAY